MNVMASALPSPSRLPSHQLLLRRLLAAGVVAKLPPPAQSHLRAILLAGSVARGEGSWLSGPRAVRLLGDVDALLVFDPACPLPAPATLAAMERHVAARWRDRGLLAEVSIKAVHPSYLRRLPPHIFGYELRHGGQCVWGDPAMLELIPEYPRRALEREDAWRLLTHRLIEALPSALGHAAGPPARPHASPVEALYPWIKLHLDMATSYLVFCGEYEPTYAARALRLHAHWGRAATIAPPLAADFAIRVLACTEWKLAPEAASDCAAVATELCASAWADARALWLWELGQMVGASSLAPDRAALWRRWLRSRSWPSRARGWVSAARRVGAAGSLRLSARWARMAARATPRHWIYQAAGELMFGLVPDADCGCRWKTTPGGNLCFDPAAVSARLPLPPPGGRRAAAGADVLLRQLQDNYHRLVQTTRT